MSCQSRAGAPGRPPPAAAPEDVRLVEEHYAEWYRLQGSVPGVEVHDDPDITWVVLPVWGFDNVGIGLRFQPSSVERRLDEILDRYGAADVGAGFWVSPLSEPDDLEERLRRRALRCRKYFPGMRCDLRALPETPPAQEGLEIRQVEDHGIFNAKVAHPYLGRITTTIRSANLARATERVRRHPDRVFDWIAVRGGSPVGVCTLFLGSRSAGFHDVGVLPGARGHGVATALMDHACRFARSRGYDAAVLLSTALAYSVYERVGFREVCRIGYWYQGKTAKARAQRSPASARAGGATAS